MASFDLPPLSLDIIEGNIVDQRVDAIVNAANNEFWMGAGVAGAIKAVGGNQIEADAIAQGPVEPGACVVTSGGRLPVRHVIHAAVMGQDLRTSGPIISLATTNALATADQLSLQSIALPAFGTGVGGFPLEECARLMIDAVKHYRQNVQSLKQVRLVLFGEAACDTFVQVARATIREGKRE